MIDLVLGLAYSSNLWISECTGNDNTYALFKNYNFEVLVKDISFMPMAIACLWLRLLGFLERDPLCFSVDGRNRSNHN